MKKKYIIGLISLLVAVLTIYELKKPTPERPAPTVEAAEPIPERPAPTAEVAQPKPVQFDIQGMRIGDKLTEEFAYSHCPAKDEGEPDITCNDFIDINGKKVFIFFHFDDFRLIYVSLSFDPDVFDDLIKAYTAKFGVPPHNIKTVPITTRLGASYMNIIATWFTTSGHFIISKYGNSVDKGFAILDTPEGRQYLERKQVQDTAVLKNRL